MLILKAHALRRRMPQPIFYDTVPALVLMRHPFTQCKAKL